MKVVAVISFLVLALFLGAYYLATAPNSLNRVEVVVQTGTDSAAPAAPALAGGVGTALAFTSREGRGVRVRLPSGEDWEAYGGKLAERFLAWAPGGRYLAFRIEKDEPEIPRRFALMVADLEKRTTERITDYMPGLGRPGWRSLGSELEVFVAWEGSLIRRKFPLATPLPPSGKILFERDGDVWLEDGEGEPRQLTRGGGYAPLLSPDETRFLYEWADGIHVANLDDPVPVDRRPLAGGVSPVWSPDGTRIAYCRHTDRGHDDSREGDIYILDLTSPGATPRRATETPAEIEAELNWPEANVIYYSVLNDGTIRKAEIR